MTDKTTLKQEDILVRAQDTPNPYAFKFIVNQPIKIDGKATFAHPEEGEGLPLVQSLFSIDGVQQVYLFQNTLTITHNGVEDEDQLKQQVISVIRSRLPVHDPGFLGPDEAPKKRGPVDRSHLPKEVQLIEEILDRTIRPGLQADGGDVEVISYENNELRILYQGACGGCPSAMMGTLEAIEGILSAEIENPELRVIPI